MLGCSPIHCQLPSHFGAEDARPWAEAEPDASAGRASVPWLPWASVSPPAQGSRGPTSQEQKLVAQGPGARGPAVRSCPASPGRRVPPDKPMRLVEDMQLINPLYRREVRLRNTRGDVCPGWTQMQASDPKHASLQGRQDTSHSASGARGAQLVSALCPADSCPQQAPNTNMHLRGRCFLPGLSNNHS